MIADGKRFLSRKTHIAGYYIDALLSVTVRKLVVVFKGIYSFPSAAFVLDVSEALFIHAYLAKIVKQRYYRNTLIGI